MNEKIHRGHILRKVISDRGVKISQLARNIGRSRRFIYIMFDKEDVPLHYMKIIGEAINYDFFAENNSDHNNISNLYQKEDYWKNKYINLLEEYNQFIKLHYGKY